MAKDCAVSLPPTIPLIKRNYFGFLFCNKTILVKEVICGFRQALKKSPKPMNRLGQLVGISSWDAGCAHSGSGVSFWDGQTLLLEGKWNPPLALGASV